ncbi:MAG: DUF4388 domain-containing protein [bacterium]|mgnify:CR=1 FL=1|nr:DUF4388 domain-containing protein [bacterium]
MSFWGTFELFTLSEVLQLLHMGRKSGTLDSWNEFDERKIFFYEGNIIYAEAVKYKEKIGDILVKSRAINDIQLSKALKIQRDSHSNKKIGEILVEAGFITKERLIEGITRQTEESIYELFDWENGHFRFEEKEIVPEDMEFVLNISIQNIIMEGTRRIDELDRIREVVPSLEIMLTLNANADEDTTNINLNPNEWKVLSLIDGKRTANDIVLITGFSEFDLSKVIYSLVTVGLVELQHDSVDV